MTRYVITTLTIAAIIFALPTVCAAPPQEPKELTVLTYNTHLFYGSAAHYMCALCNEDPLSLFCNCDLNKFLYDDQNRFGHIAIKVAASGADIVALQEVWAPFVQQGFVNTLAPIYPHAYFVDSSCDSYIFDKDTLSNGLVLLSKWPLNTKEFNEFPTFFPSCFMWNYCENWANKGVLTAIVDVNGVPIRIGISHALTGPDDEKSKWDSDYIANAITTFQLNGEAYIFALKKNGQGHIRHLEDYSYFDETTQKQKYGAGWKHIYAGTYGSDYRAVVSFELNGHPYLFGLSYSKDEAYITRINNDPSTGWQTFGPYFWDKDYKSTTITSFQLNGQAYIFGLKSGWNQAWFYRINTDPSTGEFNPSEPFEEFGYKDLSRYVVAITSFESNGRPWLYSLKSSYDQVFLYRINEDLSTGKLNRANPFTEYGPFTDQIDRDFIGETITSFQLNGRAYIFGLKSGWDQAWLYRIKTDPSTGLESLGWYPWTRDYVAVESFEMNGHPYLFALRNCCAQHACDFIPGVPVPLYPSQCDACQRGLPGEAYLKHINDDPNTGWENLYQLEDIKIIRDQTIVVENGPPAIMMGDFNIHRGKYGIIDQLFRKAGALDAYTEAMIQGEDGNTIDLWENKFFQHFYERENPVPDPNDPNFLDQDDRIDYVYFKQSGAGLRLIPTEAYVIRNWQYGADNMDLSDHYPVVVKFRILHGGCMCMKGDFDCDGFVDLADLAILCSSWLSEPGSGVWNRACDISAPGDDFIDMNDFGEFAKQWRTMAVHNVTRNKGYVSIQSAINDANDGDQIEVAPGTYYGAIDFKNKAIRLYSSGGQDVTTIDGSGAYHVVQCISGEDANTILEGFTITGGNANGPTDADKSGGGMYNSNSSPTVTNCTFADNSASFYGGGMENYYSNPTVTNCTFTGNSASVYDGGGMFNNACNPTVTDCTFSNNTANRNGGGIYSSRNSNPTVTRCTFAGNKALSPVYGGGGMFNNNACNPTVKDCIFTNNTATHNAGGMYNINNSSPSVTNCIFRGNKGVFGGGMLNDGSSPIMTNCTFSGNSASSNGGGMYNVASSSPTLTYCTFSGNTADVYGGGMVNAYNSSPVITDCTFTDNVAHDGNGGGMWNLSNSSPTVTNCTFSYNNASQGGGGMDSESSSPTVTNCTFIDNQAKYGGGMDNYNNSAPTITNCTFSRNNSSVGGGGVCNSTSSSPKVTNCSFSGNQADSYGGGMYNYNSNPTVTNCILWGNTPDEIRDDGSSSSVVTYSDVQGGYGGTGNISLDPLFVDASGGNLRLSSGSPCIDKGSNAAVPPGITTDLDGNPRIANGIVDMGAYEYLITAGQSFEQNLEAYCILASRWLTTP